MTKKRLNIYKKNDGHWEGRIASVRWPGGNFRYRSAYGKTFTAVRKEIKNQQKSTDPKSICAKDQSFGDVLQLWLENGQAKSKGATVNKYRNLINTHILPTLGNLPITKIDAPTINSFLRKELENGRLDGNGGLSPSYVRSMMIVIMSAVKFAADEKMCEPLRSQIIKPAEKKKELNILTPEQQRVIETSCCSSKDLTKLGILISLNTGLRIGEICALTWKDVDLTQQVIHVRHTVARIGCGNGNTSSKLIIDSPKTQSSMRDIPISEKLTNILKTKKEDAKSEYIISDSDGFVSPRTYDYRYHRMLAEMGVPTVNYHTLRHTFATRCIEAGVDVKSLSEILGHAHVSVTLDTYVHSSIEMKRTQLQKFFSLNC